MLITKTDMQLSSKHESESSTVRQLKLAEMPRADSAFRKLLDERMQAPPPQLLAVGVGGEAARTQAGQREGSPFAAIMEMLFGIKSALAQGSYGLSADGESAPRGFSVMELVRTRESESCSFAASGNVCLADGSTRQFEVGYRMERSEESTQVSIGTFRDPLMLDFAAPLAALNPHSVDFDLDNDGATESMRMPAANAAVLFHDRNRNGVADNGSELFGPQSGDGFAELAQLDGDGNGWIDAGDAAYADLKLWQLGDDGASRVRSLAEAEISALATQSEETPFTLKEDGESVGQVRASGIWLGEKSGAGIVRQVDVATTPHTAQKA